MTCCGSCGSNLPCGCCAGIQIATSVSEVNPPGLSALSYRLGTYATFFETMLARLSNLYLDVPSAGGNGTDRIYPLRQLTTREPTDPSIAMLDAWAVVADVLTFYQERIANEGYLPTAIHRRSILELGALAGYQLRPGVAASVYLAFTVAGGFDGTIPAGTRAQSVPGTGQTPQFFETSVDLPARNTWNNLQPRLTRPQVIAVDGGPGIDPTLVRTLYFAGLGTNLKPGDTILTTLSDIPLNLSTGNPQVLRVVDSVTPQPADQRTLVTLLMPDLQANAADSVLTTVTNTFKNYVAEASAIFPGSDIAAQVAQTLSGMLSTVSPQTVSQIPQMIPGLQAQLAIAQKRNFTRVQAWLTDLIADINTLIELSSASSEQMVKVLVAGPPGSAVITGKGDVPPPALANLGTILGRLTASPSIQPANSLRLSRNIQAAYAVGADTIPRLISALNPAASSLIYSAWKNVVTTPSPLRVFAPRAKAAFFASNYAGPATYHPANGTTTFGTPTITNTWNGDDNWNGLVAPSSTGIGLPQIALDSTYDQIKARSWVAIDRPDLGGTQSVQGRIVTYHRILRVQTQSMNTMTGYTAKSTVLTLDPPWLSDLDDSDSVGSALIESAVLRETVIYAQSEALELAEEPLDRDVEGNTVELNGLYDGLESGRWIIVSGERTDIANVTGVTSSELVMIAGVQQSSSSPSDPVHTTLALANALSYTYDSNNVSIYGNVVNATHGQTVGDVLGDGDGSQEFQSFALHQSPLTYISAPTPAGALSTLTTTVNEVEWSEVGDLAGAGPRDRDYITRTDDSGNTVAIFGNGQHGARVPTGSANVKAVYRYGIGSPGNVDAGQISQLATHPLGLQAVINPIAASGGADRDSAGQARSNTPIAVMALDRLVSVKDYADFARAYAGIGKASSARITDGRRQLVHLTVAGAGDIPIDVNSDLYRNLATSLSAYGDPYLPIQVAVRSVKLLVISAGVQLLPDYEWESVEPNIRAAVLALFSFEARDLGQTAFLSEAISAMQQVQGVSYVNVQVFDSVGEGITDEQLAGLSGSLKLRQYVLAELAQLNPTATDLSQRILPAELVFMLPDIADTLILSQIGA